MKTKSYYPRSAFFVVVGFMPSVMTARKWKAECLIPSER